MEYYDEDDSYDLVNEEEYNSSLRDIVSSLGCSIEKESIDNPDDCDEDLIYRDYNYDEYDDVDELSFDDLY